MQNAFNSFRLPLIYGSWWLMWIALQVAVIYNLGFSWEISVADSLVNNLLLGISSYAMSNALRYYQPRHRNFFYLLMSGAVLSLINTFVFQWILSQVIPNDTFYQHFVHSSFMVRFAVAWLMTTSVNLLTWGWYNIQSQQQNEKRKNDAEKLAREAELFKLRQQLQPHFLFNSLNSISALAGSKPEEARKMIQQLSDFLRGTLKKEEQQLVSLQDELQHLSLYLEIEKVRFGHRLHTVIECDEETKTMKLPSLLLQPVMENAIKFGLYDTVGDITIGLTAKAEKNQLLITVQNPFDPLIAKPTKGTGFGLASVQRRLYLLFARQDLLQTQQQENIFITSLTIPQLT